MALHHEQFPAVRLSAGATLVTGWATMPDPFAAEMLARFGFADVVLDLQHGYLDEQAAFRAIGNILLAGAAPAVRIPVDAYALASRALDFGAAVIIAPMINCQADAQRFIDAVKYPPTGRRSWGPARAIDLLGFQRSSILGDANADTLALAMIETTEAIDSLDAILDVEGLDGIFVGPSDLSIALSGGAFVDPEDEAVDEAIDYILDRALSAGKVPGIYAVTSEQAQSYLERGFRYVAVSSDVGCLRRGVESLLAELT